MIGHHSGLRDVMGQSYLICACTRANHVRYSSVHVTSFSLTTLYANEWLIKTDLETSSLLFFLNSFLAHTEIDIVR